MDNDYIKYWNCPHVDDECGSKYKYSVTSQGPTAVSVVEGGFTSNSLCYYEFAIFTDDLEMDTVNYSYQLQVVSWRWGESTVRFMMGTDYYNIDEDLTEKLSSVEDVFYFPVDKGSLYMLVESTGRGGAYEMQAAIVVTRITAYTEEEKEE